MSQYLFMYFLVIFNTNKVSDTLRNICFDTSDDKNLLIKTASSLDDTSSVKMNA